MSGDTNEYNEEQAVKVVSVLNQKGGVGKSNVVRNLAATWALDRRVLVVDADPMQRSTTTHAEAADASGTELPYDFDAVGDADVLASLRGFDEYDVIVVDTPGTLAESELPRFHALLSCTDFVVLPIEPAIDSIQPLRTTLEWLIEPAGLPFRVLLSRVKRDSAGRKAFAETQEAVDGLQLPRFETVIREYHAHSVASRDGSVVTNYPWSVNGARALNDFKSLAHELDPLLNNVGSK
ncbi:ParA family protein [Clavibacter michiganensis]|uniref:ParA family protein n=1 Tax=Clavibacter michiganensis TaxID=28447 RepID=UPI0021580C3B|nr:ParA family protein [Clavibacter michiganensis]